ncbi:SDR family NAD(P)-dependent oxidoreductase [Halopiger xanaduensis]|uniref:3-oxoacyl-(Acyl-carrier-protein) reductase n=1 Tax=Halopiger xanaduensis (strain DSM 18323 / JCM 14033 / SH-6) TaxID=797210 RepID=F8D8A3_HALXS|nr:SDR family oxidoreductase [Halopiger xanaduensis]AEH36793.1 3-oxoacyl-(acyl-carrier-protein) reductase [Halopiger xanaduensis SH-6]
MGALTYDFDDETAIVTGGASGIGREVATRFGEAGATVIVADVREEPKREGESTPTHERIEDAGGRATFVETDVTDPDDVAAVVEAAREFGGVDVMVNNAAIYRHGSVLETDLETFDRLLEINVQGVLAGTRAAARDMLARDEPGTVVNTASISSEYAQLGHSMYDSSKGAVMMLTRVAALELAPYDVRVNAVAPGIVKTAFGAEGPDRSRDEGLILEDADVPDPLEREGEIGTDIPMGRMAESEDIAGPYLFLASDDAEYMTGHLLYVDGGYSIL